MVELRDLVKHYASGGEVIRALDGVTMTIAPGEFVALYGPSGSGKTTLLSIVAGVLKPDRGSVMVAGRDVTAMSAGEAATYRRLELGYVDQKADLLLGVSAIDNATLKLLDLRIGTRKARHRVAPLMERLGLQDRLRHQPHQLSAGERQRVLIARALSTDPNVVIADEPTGNLDSRRSSEVLTLLADVCRERDVAVLLVTHDPQAAAYADRVAALSDGRLGEYRPDLDLARR